MSKHPYSLFQAFGIELEYMIVDATTLDVLPICDELLAYTANTIQLSEIEADERDPYGDVAFDNIGWSNELVLHVLELKGEAPFPSISAAEPEFHENVQRANQFLKKWNACLMPTAMHPWMNPEQEMRIWPHDNADIYAAFDRIFNCTGHGWANLQSTHWNLPFESEEEFAKLHTAIRIVLPLIPVLAASSPIYNCQTHDFLDSRLDVYRHNSKRIPSIAGRVIPELVSSEQEYDERIYQPMFRDIAPYDPEGTLQHIWLNSRGAIARFDRGAIEIRVMDIQECPKADLAIGQLIASTVELLVQGAWASTAFQAEVTTEELAEQFDLAIRYGRKAKCLKGVQEIFQLSNCSNLGELWQHVLQSLTSYSMNTSIRVKSSPSTEALKFGTWLLQHGSLSERILRRVDGNFSRDHLVPIYRELCDSLQSNTIFEFHPS